MQPQNRRWQVPPRLSVDADRNLQEFHPLLRQILYNRGYATCDQARIYLEARRPSGTSPYGMTGVPEAVDRIQWAIQHAEPIVIYGDYDVDGVTATALLTEVLQSLEAVVYPYIPNRYEEGYGLNNEALEKLYTEGARLAITVDCGIRSQPEADFARQLGLDMIITDHHHPSQELPVARAVINPKQSGDVYPEKDLAGVGVAYKLACALLASEDYAWDTNDHVASNTLDLVALGTVADLAPLVGENRALVRAGLERIRRPTRQGVQALIGASGLKSNLLTATEIGFALGPRLNAAGRLETAIDALTLLQTKDLYLAGTLAQKLDNQNRERQTITQQITERAEQAALTAEPEAFLLFAADPDFKSGVVGLAASRLSERYYRPAIVATIGETTTRGSCRSIPEFHITQALDQCADLLVHHGGHAAAAGFTVQNENLPGLMDRLKTIATQCLGHLDLHPVLPADAEIALSDLRPELLKYLAWMQPTGYGNPQAAFVSRNCKVVNSRAVGKDGAHLKLTVTDGRITYDAIAFRQGHWQASLPRYVDLLYTFEMNEFNGRSSLQLNVRDLKASESYD